MTGKIQERPELAVRCTNVLAQMERDFGYAAAIVAVLMAHDRIHQNKVGKMAGVPGRDCARIIATMEKSGRLWRTATEKTYELVMRKP